MQNRQDSEKNSGTREAIFNLQMLSEKYIEVDKDIYACFIDYSKAFDTVSHDELISTLQKTTVDQNDIMVIKNLYWQQQTMIRLDTGLSDPVKIKRGVRQGCVLSPVLFNLYTEHIFRNIEGIPGLIVGGNIINNLRYADDTVLLAESATDLQNLVTIVKEKSEEVGLKMNIKKTKTMVISKRNTIPELDIRIDGKAVEQVSSFTYLGQLVTEDGRSEKEIKRRIGLAKSAFEQMKDILTYRRISLDTRLRLAKCYIWPKLTFACETWTLSKVLTRKINAFEMWTYRRIKRLSWKEKRSNKSILQDLGLKSTRLLQSIKAQKLRYYGHIRRHDTLQRTILEGKINGKRGKGRRRDSWTSNIADMTGMKINLCSKVAMQRDEWRAMASNLSNEMEPE